MEQFNQIADSWCKQCGSGDSVNEFRKSTYEEEYDLEENYIDEDFLESNSTYRCTVCGAESTEPDDLITVSPNEAKNAWVAKHPVQPTQVDEDEDVYYEDGE